MTPDSFTEVTSRNVFQRFGDSIKGILIGIILIIIAFPVLWWNEGRAVHRAQTLEQGVGAVISVAADVVDPDHEGGLVHLSDTATTDAILRDPDFAVSGNAIKLVRDAQMYQWEEKTSTETKKKLGGSEETVTTYDYVRIWSPGIINSSGFRHPEEHANPGSMRYGAHQESADEVRVGGYRLPSQMLDRIDKFEPIAVEESVLDGVPEDVRAIAHVTGSGIYLGASPNAPAIGDLQLTFSRIPPTPISLMAKQFGNSFEPYEVKHGSIYELRTGTFTAGEMFAMAEKENRIMTWILRGAGFVLMAVGLAMVMGPLAVVADVIPFVGSLVRTGSGLVAGLLSFALSMITIGIAWLAYRPLLGVGLLALSLMGFVGLRSLSSSEEEAAPVVPTPPAPPPPPPPPPTT